MKNEEKINRRKPTAEVGLTKQEVEERQNLGLVNKTKTVVGKTYLEIILTDVFSFFNVLLFIIAGLMIAAQYWWGLLFLLVLIPNIIISLVEDLHARRLMSKLQVMNQPKSVVVRDGVEYTISSKEVVLDDVVIIKTDNQICVDGPLISGEVTVNESALTGEALNIVKKPGDMLYSGSFVVGGTGYMLADKISFDSYIETIQAKAKKFKRSPSEILKSLTRLFRVIGIAVIVMAIATGVIYTIKGGFSSYEAFKESMKSISGSMISMIPSGLYLLTSIALAISVLKLNKKKARVQDFYSVEMLARVDILCVDKTGTITSGEMSVKNLVIYNPDYNEDQVSQIISNLLEATKDNNLTAQALRKTFAYDLSKGVVTALPFNSENKYSAATFTGGETYVLGALEFLNISSKAAVNHRMEEYTKQGYRVLVLAKSLKPISNNKITSEVIPVALIALQDSIRKDVISTFRWFKENNVRIKVISGDDALTVSRIAHEAEIEGSERFISLAGMALEDIPAIIDDYDVFGRVTPEQKEVIIKALKAKGHTVAMTGDGINDILALKRADCSIAMNSGSESAKNVSHIVLTNSDFNSLPSVVAEGRKVINNLQRTGALFLTKTIFAFTTSLIFLITMIVNNTSYPFQATHFHLWTMINIGLAAFFLALEINKDPMRGSFMGTILGRAIPGSVAVMAPVFVSYILYVLQKHYILYTGVYTYEAATTMSVLGFTIMGLFVLLKICLPFSLYRGFVFGGTVLIEAGLSIAAAFASFKIGVSASVLEIDFPSLTIVNYFTLGIMIVLIASIYILVSYIVEIFRGEHLNVKNKS